MIHGLYADAENADTLNNWNDSSWNAHASLAQLTWTVQNPNRMNTIQGGP